MFAVGKTGSDYYFRKLLERWRREELGPSLGREERQALVDWDKTPSDLRAQLKHEITEAGPTESRPLTSDNVCLLARPSRLDGTARTLGGFLAQRVVLVVTRDPRAVLRGRLTHGALGLAYRGYVLFLRLPVLVAWVSVVAHLRASTRKASRVIPDAPSPSTNLSRACSKPPGALG